MMMILDHILGHLYHILCIYVMGWGSGRPQTLLYCYKENSSWKKMATVTVISVTFICLNQGKLSAWQKLSLLFSLHLLSLSFPSYSLLHQNSKLTQSLFTTQGHLLVLRCHTLCWKDQLLQIHFWAFIS